MQVALGCFLSSQRGQQACEEVRHAPRPKRLMSPLVIITVVNEVTVFSQFVAVHGGVYSHCGMCHLHL